MIDTAVFPVAGLGTRFLPVTKSSPKEMLPLVDRPIIQYVVDEAIQAGIKNLVFVTSHTKRSIEDYFDTNHELEMQLEEAGKHTLLNELQNLVPSDVNCIYVRQPEPLGLGDAVLRACCAVGQQPFAVLLPDDIIAAEENPLQKMIELFAEKQASVIGVEQVPHEDTKKYGIITPTSEDLLKPIQGIVEKPDPEEAPSNYAAVGRYVFAAEIFKELENTSTGKGGEIQLTDAIASLLTKQPVYAHAFSGKRYDCGSKIGFLKATVDFALSRDDLSEAFAAYLKAL